MNESLGLKSIQDKVNGITLGPNRSESGGVILDQSNMTPGAAGARINEQAILRMQADNAQQIAAVRQENAQTMNALANQISALTQGVQAMAQPQAPQVDPRTQYALDENEAAELGSGHLQSGITKLSMAAAEEARRGVLQETQSIINQYSAAQDQRIKELEAAAARRDQQEAQKTQIAIDELGAQYGLNMATIGSNRDWLDFMEQPVSDYDRTPLKTKMAEAVHRGDLGFFRTAFSKFTQNSGSSAGLTGTPNGANGQTGFAGPNNSPNQMTGVNIGGGAGNTNPNGSQPPNLSAQREMQEVEEAYHTIQVQKENLNRQLQQERSITRETYTADMAQLTELEAQLFAKRRQLLGNAA